MPATARIPTPRPKPGRCRCGDSSPGWGRGMSSVFVMGGSGYVGTTLVTSPLRDGRQVRTTTRSLQHEGEVRAAVQRGQADDSAFEVIGAELTADDRWAAAVAGCQEVHHVAPPMIHSDGPDEVIPPARDGTLRVLRAAPDAGVRPVVLTSSFGAIGYTPKPVSEYSEDDWTDTPGLSPYPHSKAIADGPLETS